MIREDVFERAESIPAEPWDRAAPGDFFFQRGFLRVMQESAVEDARYRYLLLRSGSDEPAGLAVLSAFTLKLDLLSGDPWVKRLRRWIPSLLDVPMVCCGIPASFGQHHLHVARPEDRAAAVDAVHGYMEAWAEEIGCGMLLWKEWCPAQGLREHARRAGYVVLPTLPDHVVEPLCGTIEGYVGRMRSAYRRKFRTAAALMEGPGPRWRHGPFQADEKPFAPGDAGAFHDGYREVMSRTAVRLETYPRAFFDRLAESDLGVRLLRVENRSNGESVTAMLIPSGGCLTFALIAKDRAHYEAGLYTLLLQCIVLYSIQRGFRSVRLGQTSGYAKCSAGAQPRRLETFIRMRRPPARKLVETFGSSLFPTVGSPRLRVFRDADALPSGGAGTKRPHSSTPAAVRSSAPGKESDHGAS